MQILLRDAHPRTVWSLQQQGIHPLLAQLYAARGVQQSSEVQHDLSALLPPQKLKGMSDAVAVLLQARAHQQKIVIVADYDCDGATACAVALRGLRLLGFEQVDYLVPNRMVDGYGLTAALAERVHAMTAAVLMTVDNGIASVEGVARARALGLQVIVTDHHLPGNSTPNAHAIVNPNQYGCNFPSKHLAGVGVMFYVLLGLRAALRDAGAFAAQQQPRLDALLPLVALGTVADVVKLDSNNRCLVAQGLARIRKGAMPAGMSALFSVASRNYERASSFDLGFALGPRINAAGRMDDMSLGIACLMSDDPSQALDLAQQLDRINRERRQVEAGMRDQALAQIDHVLEEGSSPGAAISLFDPDFHEGVVGIVAARLKERWHRPTFVFAPSMGAGQEHLLKGSGRSIAGFHLRDALDLFSKRHPQVLHKFGGHAMAAGCTLDEEHFEIFEHGFAQVATELMDPSILQRRLQSDGPLAPEYRRVDVAQLLDQTVWGQGFEAPVFSEPLDIVAQRLVGENRHLSLKIRHHGAAINAIWFGRTEPVQSGRTFAYRLSSDEFRGETSVQFLIEGAAD